MIFAPINDAVDDFLTAGKPTQVIVVLYIIAILYLVSVFIAMTVAATSEPLSIKMPSNVMPMRRRSPWFWQ